MYRGLHIASSDICFDKVWTKIIATLSGQDSYWSVDCLDCLYETELKEGIHSTDILLQELENNTYIFFARMINIPAGQKLDKNIVCSSDYFESNCQSIVFCTDGGYFDVFSKNYDLLVSLYDQLHSDIVELVEWIDDSLGGRSEFTM